MDSYPELPATPKDAFYTAVGFAVLATQKFQVRRRELQKQVEPVVRSTAATTAERLEAQRRDLQKQVEPTVRGAAGRLREAAGALDDRVDPVLDQLQGKLPEASRGVVRQARVVAKGARNTVLEMAAGDRVPGPSGPQSGDQGPSGPQSGDQGPSGPQSGSQGPSGPQSGSQGPSGPQSGDQGPSGPQSGDQSTDR